MNNQTLGEILLTTMMIATPITIFYDGALPAKPQRDLSRNAPPVSMTSTQHIRGMTPAEMRPYIDYAEQLNRTQAQKPMQPYIPSSK